MNVFLAVVPTTTSLPPLTLMLDNLTGSAAGAAWAAGTASAETARAPVTTAADTRMRIEIPK